MIPYGRQNISEEDIAAVVAVLRSDFLTQGPAVPAFEQAVVDWVGGGAAVAVNSATSALHIGCLALGVGEGSRVWTSPNSFVASSNAALYCGAQVDFVDIDPATYNMDMGALARKLETAGYVPDVVVPVHFSGQSCDMKALDALRQQYGFKVMEDASHAIGALYDGKPVGDCRYSDVCVFSFHPVKIVTTAEGGMVTTQDAEMAERLRMLRSHGITRDASRMQESDPAGWYYEQQLLGWNYRMTDMQAALGASQMQRLQAFVRKRRELAARYDAMLAQMPEVVTPAQLSGQESAWHLYVIQVPEAKHRAVFDAMRAQGVGVNLHYIPIHTQPYYRTLGFGWGMFPQAEAYYRRAISLPMFPDLTDAQQQEVVRLLREALA